MRRPTIATRLGRCAWPPYSEHHVGLRDRADHVAGDLIVTAVAGREEREKWIAPVLRIVREHLPVKRDDSLASTLAGTAAMAGGVRRRLGPRSVRPCRRFAAGCALRCSLCGRCAGLHRGLRRLRAGRRFARLLGGFHRRVGRSRGFPGGVEWLLDHGRQLRRCGGRDDARQHECAQEAAHH